LHVGSCDGMVQKIEMINTTNRKIDKKTEREKKYTSDYVTTYLADQYIQMHHNRTLIT
jgi:hypothetical protein